MENEKILDVIQAYIAGQVIEAANRGLNDWEELPSGYTEWNFDAFDYRVKPLDPDTFDWSAASPGFKWLARDLNGDAFLYVSTPYQSHAKWSAPSSNALAVSARHFSSYVPGPRDWKDSLQGRPE